MHLYIYIYIHICLFHEHITLKFNIYIYMCLIYTCMNKKTYINITIFRINGVMPITLNNELIHYQYNVSVKILPYCRGCAAPGPLLLSPLLRSKRRSTLSSAQAMPLEISCCSLSKSKSMRMYIYIYIYICLGMPRRMPRHA